jgi:hypothetical protein
MAWISQFVRYLGVFGDPQLHPETISDLPPFALRQTLEALLRAGWMKTFEYDAEDAWVDYARVDLRRGRSKLRLEWDQDSGGSVEGPRAVLDELRVLDPWTHVRHAH